MTEVNTIQEAYNLMKPFRVVIAGTRTFSNYELLKIECDAALKNRLPNVVVISGGNRRYDKDGALQPSADLLGEQYAIERELECRIIPAKWKSQGKPAGPGRNAIMAGMADAAIVFQIGESSGSASMISESNKAGIPVKIIKIKS